MFKDYYSILGVPPSASGDAIRQAFKRLALLSHPDKTMSAQSVDYNQTMYGPSQSQQQQQRQPGGNSALQQMLFASTMSEAASTSRPAFTDVQEAYEVLGDVARRYLYDLNYYELIQQQQLQQQQQQRMAHAYTQPAPPVRRAEPAAPPAPAAAAAAVQPSHTAPRATHETNSNSCNVAKEHSRSKVQKVTQSPSQQPVTLTREAVQQPQQQQATQPSAAAEDTTEAVPRKAAHHRRRVSKTTASCSEHAASSLKSDSSRSSNAAAATTSSLTPSPPPFSSSSQGPSSAASLSPMSSTVLPAIRTVRRVNVASWLDMKSNATTSASKRRYPMPTAAAEGVTMEYYRTRAIDKTLRAFFAKELDALAAHTTG